MKNEDWTARLTAAVEKQKKVMEAELRKLCDNPDTHAVATAFADAFLASLDRLCNFSHLVDHNGRRHDPVDVLWKVGDDLRAEFLRLTGRAYEPPMVRLAAACKGGVG